MTMIMASRYPAEVLLSLRQSPLCLKPPNLPPAEQWMGTPSDNVRAQPQRTAGTDRPKTNYGAFTLDQVNRRSVGDRTHPRNPSNSDPIVLGPPKSGFASSSIRNVGAKVGGGEADNSFREQDARERFGQRVRSDQAGTPNFSESGNFGGTGPRDTRNADFRRRGDADQDSDGWSTVKPRKSFGHEGAERFQGRMGNGGSGGAGLGGAISSGTGGSERFGRDDRRPRDREDSDRPRRTFGREAGEDATDGTRRNGPVARTNWFKENNDGGDDKAERVNNNDRNERTAQRERIDRTKNWRERIPDSQHNDYPRDRNNDRGGNTDRRWGDHSRPEHDPEWMDEDETFADDKPSGSGGHTEEDLRRFMEAMKGRGSGEANQTDRSTSGQPPPGLGSTNKPVWKTEPLSAPAVEHGPDRFFEQFSKPAKAEESSAADPGDSSISKAKASKASKFTSFFSSQEDTKRQTEPPTPAASMPPQSPPNAAGGLLALLGPPDANEKEAFQALLQKLKLQSGSSGAGSTTSPAAISGLGIGGPPGGTPPSGNPFQEPPSSATPQEGHRGSAVRSPGAQSGAQFLHNQPGLDRQDDPRFRSSVPPGPSQQLMQDLGMQRQPHMGASGQSPSSSARPEQMLQELLFQRQQAASQENGGVSRMGPPPGGPGPNMAASNSQTEFLMRLMQSRNTPDARRPEEVLMRMPQPHKQVNIPSIPDRESEMAEYRERERIALQRQQMRPTQGPPGLFGDEQLYRQEVDNRAPPQPTQILQRPPPPGLEHTMHGSLPPFLQQGAVAGRLPPQQGIPQQGPQQPMIPPPPGLGANHPGNMQSRAMNLQNTHGMLSNMPPSLPPNMPPNMLNMPNMPMPNVPNMFPPKFSPSGPFPPDGIPAGLPRNMPPPPPGFFNGPPQGPQGLPGFMPPLGMGFQGPPPDGIPFPFGDGRGMPLPPNFRRS